MNFYIKSCNVNVSIAPDMKFLTNDNLKWSPNISDARVFEDDNLAREVLYSLKADKTREFYIVSDVNIKA